MSTPLAHSFENGWFGSSPEPSAPTNKKFPRLSRDLKFVRKIAVIMD